MTQGRRSRQLIKVLAAAVLTPIILLWGIALLLYLPSVSHYAANEVAVDAFLHHRLSYTGIFDLVAETVERLPSAKSIASVEDIFDFDAQARRLANSLI